MSSPRTTAGRSERRESGRHGRQSPRGRTASARGVASPAAPDARIRPQLLRVAVLPATVASLSGAAAVTVALGSTATELTPGVWTALIGSALVAFAAVATSALGAERAARSVLERCGALRVAGARSQGELRSVLEQLRRGEQPAARKPVAGGADGDEFDLLAQQMARTHEAAVTAVLEASRLSSRAGNEQKVEVFVNLARRLQSLVHREIQLLDDLENDVEDPELLKGLFHIDHLATRIRRHAENLAVLGGAVSRRQWSRPVSMTEVLRSAVAEVEQYQRIRLVPPVEGALLGHAVADVIHLLAELVENATLFSAPQTQVLLRAQYVTSGLAVEVEDRGLGIHADQQRRMNALLADPDQVSVGRLLQDGRIGLFVVAALARRHGIAVRLQSNIYGGVQAVLVLPRALLGDPENRSAPATPPERAAVSPVPASQPAAVPPPAAPAPGTGPARTPDVPVRPRTAERPGPPPGTPPVPPQNPAAGGRVRTRVRPQLPRRQGLEHLAPQLREAPAAPAAGEPVLHDPGLMAAFRRGIGLAEAAGARDDSDPPTGADRPESGPSAPSLPTRPRHHPTTEEE